MHASDTITDYQGGPKEDEAYGAQDSDTGDGTEFRGRLVKGTGRSVGVCEMIYGVLHCIVFLRYHGL